MRIDRVLAVLVLVWSLHPGDRALAQDENLAQKANDPTASLMAFQLQDFYSPNLHNSDASLNVVQFRAAVPFMLAGYSNIARVTVPGISQSPSGVSGISDTTLFDLVTFQRDWGRFGIGAVALVPTGSQQTGTGQWAIGPAFGFTAKSGTVLWGLFNQNLFSVAERFDGPDMSASTLQPILSVSLKDGWSIGTSDMTFLYDWNAGKFTSIPLGIKVSKLVQAGRTPVQVQLSYEHNFYDESVTPADTIGLTVKLLVPSG